MFIATLSPRLRASILPPMPHTLTNPEKRALKARAQRLEPAVKLGHAGITEAFLKSMDEALATHELVKMKFSDFKEEKKMLAPEIADRTQSELITLVGNVAIFFRAKPAAPNESKSGA
jgi:RNA-binding protein